MNIGVRHWCHACVCLLLSAGLAMTGTATAAGVIAGSKSSAARPLVAGKPRPIADSTRSFEFLEIDTEHRRFLGCHADDGTLDVFDLDSGQLLKQIATGRAQDVDEDDGTSAFVIDTAAQKIVASVSIPEAPEYLVYDPVSDRIFQNIKSSDEVVVIGPARNIVTEQWSTAPAKSPHGLALDSATHRLFVAGKNSELAVLDTTNGRLVTSVSIPAGVDQIVFDPSNKRLYCAGSGGIISVVQEAADCMILVGPWIA